MNQTPDVTHGTREDIETFERLIKGILDKRMKREIRRKPVQGKTVEVEPIWMTRQIKKAMSKTRTYKNEEKEYIKEIGKTRYMKVKEQQRD